MDDPLSRSDRLDVLAGAASINPSRTITGRLYSPVSNEKRGLILHAINTIGMSVTSVALHYNVPRSTVSSIKRVYEIENGRTIKKTNRGKRTPILSEDQKLIVRQWVDNNCLLTLPQIRREFERQFGQTVSNSTLSRALRAFHYTIKVTSVVAERASSDAVIQARARYAEDYLRNMSRRESMFFVDETGFSCSMRTRFGRARRGDRAVVHVPAIKSKNFSICAVYNIAAMFSFTAQQRPFNTESFLNYMQSILAKFREHNINNAIIVMDNVAFHHSQIVCALVEEAGHQMKFLPPYSPFLNPIENVFNQWKNTVKHAPNR